MTKKANRPGRSGKLLMRRKAADNKYMHKDFHGGLSCGIQYVSEKFGKKAVTKFLEDFARSYYKPLNGQVKAKGLSPIRKYYEKIFEAEEGKVSISETPGELVIEVEVCPAIEHMNKRGLAIAKQYCETTRIMNECLCEGTGFVSELRKCNPKKGSCVQVFRRKP